MRRVQSISAPLHASLAVGAFLAAVPTAVAGGVAVREQSASWQGASFAGSASGGDLSSMFWNPAAIGIAGVGVTTQSSYSLILPSTDISGSTNNAVVNSQSTTLETSTDRPAIVGATYGAFRLNEKLVLGVSVNSPFGISNEPNDDNFSGRLHDQGTKIFSFNATPTLAYEISPGLHIAAGMQLQYARMKFQFSGGPLAGANTADIDVHDGIGVGFTLGLLWQPNPGTSIGLGFRSSVHHDLDGTLERPANFVPAGAGLVFAPAGAGDISIGVDLPEIVTLSIRQAVAPSLRALGTVEWTNWSRIDVLPVVGSGGVLGGADRVLDLHWRDGWLFALGAEYDYLPHLTLRTGVAYEISPVNDPNFRLLQVPDSNRWWVSGGATYRYSESLSFDFAYSHVFLEDAAINRGSLSTPALVFSGEAKQSADIISVGLSTRW